MKKLIALILIAVSLFTLTTPAFAAAVQPEPPAEPEATYLTQCEATLSISSGVATCTGKIAANPLYRIKVTVWLQRANGTGWDGVMAWEQSGYGSVELTRTHEVDRGYTYRTYIIGYVYDPNGVILEGKTDWQIINY